MSCMHAWAQWRHGEPPGSSRWNAQPAFTYCSWRYRSPLRRRSAPDDPLHETSAIDLCQPPTTASAVARSPVNPSERHPQNPASWSPNSTRTNKKTYNQHRATPNPAESVTFPKSAVTFAEIRTAPNISTWTGQRDHIMLATLYNTGARVSELLEMRWSDLVFGPTSWIRIHGKGSKERSVPLWPDTAKELRHWMRQYPLDLQVPLFPGRSGDSLTTRRFH